MLPDCKQDLVDSTRRELIRACANLDITWNALRLMLHAKKHIIIEEEVIAAAKIDYRTAIDKYAAVRHILHSHIVVAINEHRECVFYKKRECQELLDALTNLLACYVCRYADMNFPAITPEVVSTEVTGEK